MNAKISCLPVSLYSEFFSGQRTIPQWSQQAKDLGLGAVDINALFLREKSIEEIKSIRDQLTVPVLMVSAYSDFTEPDDSKRAEALQTALADMERASTIGARYIRLTAGQAHPDQDDRDMCQRVYACFRVCTDAAERLGLTILLENHSKPGAWQYPDYNFNFDCFMGLWEVLKELPIQVNFDVANAFALEHWQKLIDAVAGRIETVHINDLTSISPLSFSQIGQGIVPIPEMLDRIYATGFQGHLCIEEAAFRGWAGIEDAAAYTLKLGRRYGFTN